MGLAADKHAIDMEGGFLHFDRAELIPLDALRWLAEQLKQGGGIGLKQAIKNRVGFQAGERVLLWRGAMLQPRLKIFWCDKIQQGFAQFFQLL